MNKQIRNKIAQNEEGSGLVLALMVLLVLSVLGATLGVVTVGSYRLADHTQESNSAYYIAEAGANMAYEEIKKDVMAIYEAHDVTSEETYYKKINEILNVETAANYKEYDTEQFQPQLGNGPTSTVRVEESKKNDDLVEYTLISTGKIAGKTRIVEQPIRIEWVAKGTNSDSEIPVPLAGAAIIIKESLKTGTQPTVKGSIRYQENAEIDNSINPTDGKILDNILWSNYSVSIPLPELPPKKKIIESKKYQNVTEVITEDIYVSELEVRNSLNIDTQGKSVTLVVTDKLYMDNANIKVLGDGSLTIYHIGENINIQNELTLEASLISKKAITQLGNRANITGDIISGKSINITNNPDINGNVLSHGTITLDNAIVTGLIISENGDVDFKNNNTITSLVLAPKGSITFSQTSSTVKGTLLAESITLGNDSIYEYSNLYLDFLPDKDSNASNINISDLISTTPAIEQ